MRQSMENGSRESEIRGLVWGLLEDALLTRIGLGGALYDLSVDGSQLDPEIPY